MGLFNKKTKEFCVTQEILNRLLANAPHTIAMLENAFKTEENSNMDKALLYAAGLAGYACQQALTKNKSTVTVVTTKSGKKYFMGDSLNAYLLEGKYSIFSGIYGAYESQTGKKAPSFIPYFEKSIQNIGVDDYKIWNIYEPEEVYERVKSCWNGIYNNMTGRYCNSPSEWPVFFSIVLQNVMVKAMKTIPADDVFNMVIECILCISKMRDESL